MKALIFTTLALTLLASVCFAEPSVEQGKAIFAARCASCHSLNKVLTGPALAGVHERRSIDWIVSFVRSSQSLVKSGDKEAVAVFNQFNKIPMPDHPDLSADDVKGIVDYIKSQGTVATAEKPPFAKPGSLRPTYIPLSFSNYAFFIGFFGVIILLIAALLFAVQLKEYERSNLSIKY